MVWLIVNKQSLIPRESPGGCPDATLLGKSVEITAKSSNIWNLASSPDENDRYHELSVLIVVPITPKRKLNAFQVATCMFIHLTNTLGKTSNTLHHIGLSLLRHQVAASRSAPSVHNDLHYIEN